MRSAVAHPDHPAIIMAGTGEHVTHAQLQSAANRGAQLFRRLGLKPGDAIALLLENGPRFLEICWAAQRAGLYFTPLPTRLTAEEAAYIVNDCGARITIVSSRAGPAAGKLARNRATALPGVEHFFHSGASLPNSRSWAAALQEMPAARIPDETAGQHMVYSSGTTGRPKGVKLPLSGAAADAEHPFVPMYRRVYAFGAEMVYLSPAPLYHTAPLVATMTVHRIGGTVVIMEHFAPEEFLEAIERYRVTHTQLVPTMFVRMLKLPEPQRNRHDLSSLQVAIHAAAPCPVPVKRAMIEWWGPILHEYYGGTESNGSTYIDSPDWLRKPGSVGRAFWGTLHVCDDEGREVAAGCEGTIYFEGGFDFRYHNDELKTSESRNPRHPGWSTLGDIGYVDSDGYLFLTDRKAFVIVCGGVNIYPQETENVLILHPRVADAAVFGIPNEEYGEEVKAVVQPCHWRDATPAFAAQLIAYCRSQLAPVKCPRSIDFERELPRHATGKLYKRILRDRYRKTVG